jgi:hypothetical protein
MTTRHTLGFQSSYTPWREVAVYNGQVYQLKIGTKQAQIVQLAPDNQLKAATTKAANVMVPQNFTVAGLPAKVVNSMLDRAEKMAHVKWTFKKAKKAFVSNVNGVKRGDILDRKGHHVVLVLGWVSDTQIQVIESTTTAKYGKVAINIKPIKYYSDEGYTGGRYPHWVRDPTKCVPGIPCANSVGSGVAK